MYIEPCPICKKTENTKIIIINETSRILYEYEYDKKNGIEWDIPPLKEKPQFIVYIKCCEDKALRRFVTYPRRYENTREKAIKEAILFYNQQAKGIFFHKKLNNIHACSICGSSDLIIAVRDRSLEPNIKALKFRWKGYLKCCNQFISQVGHTEEEVLDRIIILWNDYGKFEEIIKIEEIDDDIPF